MPRHEKIPMQEPQLGISEYLVQQGLVMGEGRPGHIFGLVEAIHRRLGTSALGFWSKAASASMVI